MVKRGTSSYEFEKKRIEDEADAAGQRYRREITEAAWAEWQSALGRLSVFLRRHG